MIRPYGFQRISRTLLFDLLKNYGEIELVDRDHNLTSEQFKSDKLIIILDELNPIETKNVLHISDEKILFKEKDRDEPYDISTLYLHQLGHRSYWSKGNYIIWLEENLYDEVNDKQVDYYYIVWRIKKNVDWHYGHFDSYDSLKLWLKEQPDLYYDEICVCDIPCAIRYFYK